METKTNATGLTKASQMPSFGTKVFFIDYYTLDLISGLFCGNDRHSVTLRHDSGKVISYPVRQDQKFHLDEVEAKRSLVEYKAYELEQEIARNSRIIKKHKDAIHEIESRSAKLQKELEALKIK